MGDADATRPDEMGNGVNQADEKPANGGQSDELKQLLAEAHAASISKPKRVREIIGIIAWLVIMAYVGVTLVRYRETATLITSTIVMFLGVMSADLVTGIVHWTFDTWGDTKTPVFGKTAILLFREHHIVPQAFTHRDFVVTWGEPCMFAGAISLPIISPLIYPDIMTSHAVYHFYVLLFTFVFFVTSHNQIHKWAHMTQYPLPAVVQWLQKWHLLLSKEHHHVHHKPPHTNHYCLVTGLPNYPMDYFKVWRGLEWLIERLTGVKPRADDLKFE